MGAVSYGIPCLIPLTDFDSSNRSKSDSIALNTCFALLGLEKILLMGQVPEKKHSIAGFLL